MTLVEKIAAAESAYHDLQTGKSPRVVVDQNGERVEFTPANASRLAIYIAELKRELAGTSLGPMRFYF